MTSDPAAGSPHVEAGRDNSGAFAIGRGSTAITNYYFGRETARARTGPIHYDLPSLPDRYQSRDADVAEARARLLGASAAIGITSAGRAIGLKGMGGIGKTVLATAIVHDPAVRAAFPDGVAWLTFGRNAPLLAKAAELSYALTGAATSFASLSEARGQLGLCTADRRLLVVLDDVWEPAAVDPFTGLGANCRLLITSRDLRVLERAQADTHRLDVLDFAAARSFLAEAAGQTVGTSSDEADEIIRQSGRLPLALAAIGALIRQGTFPWSDALAALQEGAVDELDTGWLPDPEQRNLAVVLKLSVGALSDDVRDCLLDCAAIREDADIPEATLLLLWSTRAPGERRRRLIAQELVDRSLMQRDEQRRYRIHDLYMDYLRHVAAPLGPRHLHLIERYRDVCTAGWAVCPDDSYCVQHIAWHLHEADQGAELRALMFDPDWIRRKLAVAGLHRLLDDYALLANDREALRLAAALTLSAHVLGAKPAPVAAQLCGRLVDEDGPAIEGFLKGLRNADLTALMPIKDGYLNCPGALLRTMMTGPVVTAVEVLADGRRALTGAVDGTLRLWDLDSGAELRRFGGHGGVVNSIVELGDEQRALSGSGDRTLRLWDLESGAELRAFAGHSGRITTLAMLPDAWRALSGSDDATLRLWDLTSGAELLRLEGHDAAISSVAVLEDGRRALSSSADETLLLWDLETGARLTQFLGHIGPVRTVVVLPDGRRALSGSADGTLLLWDLETGAELRQFQKRGGWVNTVAVSAGSERALSIFSDGRLLLWDLESGVEIQWFTGHGRAVNAVAVLWEGRRALSASNDGTLRLWDLESRADQKRFECHDGLVRAVAALGDGRRVLSGSADRTLRLWDLESGIELRRFEGHGGSVTTVAVLADGHRALSGSSDGTLILWDIETRAQLQRFASHGSWVTSVAVLRDGWRALSGSDDWTLRLWDMNNGGEIRRFVGHGRWVTMVAVLGDGRRALSGSADRTLRLWDLRRGTELRKFVLNSGRVTAVALLADDQRALSGTDDGTLSLWDLESGSELRRLAGHGGCVTAVATLADGRRALAGYDDGILRLWDLEFGAEIACFVGDDAITAVAVLPGDQRAVVGDARGRLMVFPIAPCAMA